MLKRKTLKCNRQCICDGIVSETYFLIVSILLKYNMMRMFYFYTKNVCNGKFLGQVLSNTFFLFIDIKLKIVADPELNLSV